MRDEGYVQWENSGVYYRYLTEEERAGLSCDFGACAWVMVASAAGCADGYYIQIDLMSGGTPIEWTNGISPSQRPGEAVRLELNWLVDEIDSLRVSEITCMSF